MNYKQDFLVGILIGVSITLTAFSIAMKMSYLNNTPCELADKPNIENSDK